MVNNNIRKFPHRDNRKRKAFCSAFWPSHRSYATGQVMILATLAIGGAILSATAVAGFLTVSQIRQAGDFANSAKAIFAADAGLEFGMYRFFQDPTYSNGVSGDLSMQLSNGARFAVTTANSSSIKSVGTAVNARRAFLLAL